MLRDAYLYRERTGEATQFTASALFLLIGGIVATIGAALLWRSARGALGREGTVARCIVGLTVLALAAATLTAAWVEEHSGCFGPCG
jgi:hypothetical protein